MANKYTEEQLHWLRVNYPLMNISKLARQFNQRFGTEKTATMIHSTCTRYKIPSGRTGRFEKGQTAWNTGVKGFNVSGATQFNKGHRPQNTLPVGTEIMKDDGYLWIKIAEPNQWKQKHRINWEAQNGLVPDGYCLLFLDQDRINCEPENLQLITRRELLQLIRNQYRSTPETLKPTVLALTKLEVKLFEKQDYQLGDIK